MATVATNLDTHGPLLLFLLKERHEMGRGSPMMVPVAAYLHPADWYELQREMMSPEIWSAAHQFRPRPGSDLPDLNGMLVDVDHGIVEGWVIFTREVTKTRLVMRHFRCTEHEDCRKTFALGMACIADKERRT